MGEKTTTTRKPVHLELAVDSRQAIWNLIRTRKLFVTSELVDETNLDTSTVSSYLQGLLKAGYIGLADPNTSKAHIFKKKLKSRGVAKFTVYELLRDHEASAPRVRKDGSMVTQGRGREQLWRTLRMIGEFKVKDLALMASTDDHQIKESEAKDYVMHLAKAGYLARLGNGFYKLPQSRWTGPNPPMTQRAGQVFDPNLKKVVCA